MLRPARIDSLEATGVTCGFGLGVELPFVDQDAGFAGPSLRSDIQIFARKFMPMFAMRERPADCSDGRFTAGKTVWHVFLAENLLNRSFLAPASLQRSSRNIQMSRPLGNGHGLAIESKPYAVSSVVALLGIISPFAIFRSIGAVIVDALYGLPRRAFAHIGKEVLKSLPRAADINPSRAIILVRLGSRVGAPGQHPGPNAVGSGFGQAVLCHNTSPLNGAQYVGI